MKTDMKRLPLLCLVIAFALLLASCAARSQRYVGSTTIAPAAAWADISNVGHESARIVLHVSALPPIEKYAPDKISYVVWAMRNGNIPENLGTLRVSDKGQGVFVGRVLYRDFDLIVTAESDITAKQPSSQPIIRVSTAQGPA